MGIRFKADRAKQIIPFDALKGFKEALKEKEKIKVEKKELSEEEIKENSRILSIIKKRDMVKVNYFCQNEYLQIIGVVTKIDLILKELTIVKTRIKFEDIYQITIEN